VHYFIVMVVLYVGLPLVHFFYCVGCLVYRVSPCSLFYCECF